MSLPKAVGKFIVVGSQVMSRAFIQAYKQMIANSSQQSTGTSQERNAEKAKVARRGEITIREAGDILSVKVDPLSKEELEQRFQRMFKINDPKEGGSFYIQSKVFRAHERLMEELKQKEPPESDRQEQQTTHT
ncbi:TIM23 translocase complex subunit Tim16 [Schizosaccharomyces cryophilus OY26]|uniref:Mitochondrial import inner membrane translocase subunit TIM16 n=1 Tax=Schizosaccharomyces cryophilus (strain OY26 / ATCC MYA-4695 / CBS 11777 / NBRC 106824 / NRRL Y48691) TaxID=653667 RepID=S9W8Q9_SCHCR|nr:TIM23 translocase complex subunit Tim16 [Schizosaccharomyces cryophilus OY26]EPY54280.1 TIM23 translocase complex subunit Tim16 [Schizosaccharomyces cryophilus OY26]